MECLCKADLLVVFRTDFIEVAKHCRNFITLIFRLIPGKSETQMSLECQA